MPASLPTVSVVIPCFNEEGTLRELHQRIRDEFARLEVSAEIIFVDDGSTDSSRAILRELAATDALCRVIAFRCNCGKAAGLDIGFRAARGEYILTMDADLQDDPQEIPRFLEALQRVDVVSGWKFRRHDPLGKTFPSKIFNATVRHFTGVQLHDMNCGFKGYRRAVVQEIALYGELHRFIPALAAARGFRIDELAVTHHPRRSGVSKYGWERMLRGFFDLVTVVYLMKYRMRPLHLFGGVALSLLLIALVLAALLSIPMNTMVEPPRWNFFFWLLDAALFTMAPIFVGIGLLAEAQLATTIRQLPPPPITEVLNCNDATEVHHGE